MGVRIRDNFFDLSVPLDNCSLQPLDEVFVLPVTVRQIFLRDVKLSVSFKLEAGLSDRGHEFVELGQKLFFHIVRP